jgi:hypothetical protein
VAADGFLCWWILLLPASRATGEAPKLSHLFRIDAWLALLTLLILLAFIACIHCLLLLRSTLSTLARPFCTCFGLLWPALYCCIACTPTCIVFTNSAT